MQQRIPMFIGVKNKIVGPLDFKDLFLVGMCGGVIIMLKMIGLTMFYFIILSMATVFVFFSIIFLNPGGRSSVEFFMSLLRFVFKPNIFFWRSPKARAPEDKKKEQMITPPKRSPEQVESPRLKELARSFQAGEQTEEDPDTYLL